MRKIKLELNSITESNNIKATCTILHWKNRDEGKVVYKGTCFVRLFVKGVVSEQLEVSSFSWDESPATVGEERISSLAKHLIRVTVEGLIEKHGIRKLYKAYDKYAGGYCEIFETVPEEKLKENFMNDLFYLPIKWV